MQRPDGVERRYLTQFAKSFAVDGTFEIDGDTRRNGTHGRGVKGRSKTLAILEGGGRRQTPDGARHQAELMVRLERESTEKETEERPDFLLKLLLIEGTLFVQCDLPSPALFGVVPSLRSGNPMMRLAPVV